MFLDAFVSRPHVMRHSVFEHRTTPWTRARRTVPSRHCLYLRIFLHSHPHAEHVFEVRCSSIETTRTRAVRSSSARKRLTGPFAFSFNIGLSSREPVIEEAHDGPAEGCPEVICQIV